MVVEAAPPQVWSALRRVEEYPVWWPWLHDFDAEALAAGVRWTCRIRPPLPWSLRLVLDLSSVGPEGVEAAVSGDITGTASIAVHPTPSGGTSIELDAALRARRGATAALHRVAPALSRWAHDRVLDRALAQFRTGALPDDGTGGAAG